MTTIAGIEYLDTKELSAELGVAAITLIRWRLEKRGPPVTHVGRKIFYRREAVEQWILKNEVTAEQFQKDHVQSQNASRVNKKRDWLIVDADR